mgnify:CR=1 FL=1
MADSPNTNPYASPQAEQQSPDALPSRARAQSIVRRTLLIMAVCVGVNIWANFYWSHTAPEGAIDLRPALLIGNGVFFSIVFALLWIFALSLIELMARLMYMLFGRDVSRTHWLTSLHQSLWPMVPATLIGSVLWIVWLILFHLADHPGGYALDVVFQIAGHALGAWVYLTVFWNWYQLRRKQPVPTA